VGIFIWKADFELLHFPEKSALMDSQLSGCGQAVARIVLQGYAYRLSIQ
jgi:hypothetical protein